MSRRVVLSLTVVLIAVVAVFAWRRTLAPNPTLAPDGIEAAGTADDATAPTSSRADAAGLAPLPAAHLPLSDVLEPLRQRAEAGDRKAACRLALELLSCSDLDGQAAQIQAALDNPAILSMIEAVDSETGVIDKAFAEMAQDARDCAAVPADVRARAHAWLRQAALAGEPDAMMQYARGVGLTHSAEGNAWVRDPLFDAWRHEAPKMFERLVAGGDAEAVFLLRTWHSPGHPQIGGLARLVVADDRVLAATYRALYQLLQGRSGDVPAGEGEDALTEAERAMAARRAAEMHERYFKGRLLQPGETDYEDNLYETVDLYVPSAALDAGATTVVNCDTKPDVSS